MTNCGLGLEIAQGPITNPNPWMRRSQNLKEMLEIEEEKGNSINECGHDELDHTNESGQPKFSQLSQIKSIQSRPNEFSQTSSSQLNVDFNRELLIAINLKNEPRENVLDHANPNHGEILRKDDGSNNAMAGVANVVEILNKGSLLLIGHHHHLDIWMAPLI